MKAGDTLFYVPPDTRFGKRAREITVTKIGPKYVHADDMRLEPWNFDGYAILHNPVHPYGNVYASEADYKEMVEFGTLHDRINKLTREQRREVMAVVRGDHKAVPLDPSDETAEYIADKCKVCGGIAYDIYLKIIGAV